ncbi:IS3 family transposase [Microvirga arabica]|uniref:IS3 family transposase n=1 Tax=Microvirga arabica TaxID=1128671 RepID=UPI00193A8392|nr:IS3 family transposase [Microvirga arabica]MBM1175076.1 IS3 family transposase [Microvirga arabica]
MKPATGFQRYHKRSNPPVELQTRLKKLAAARVSYGYRRRRFLLRRERRSVNHKRTYRLFCEEGLSICSKAPKRKRVLRYRPGRPDVGGLNEVRAMSFMADQLVDSRPLQIRTGRCVTWSSLELKSFWLKRGKGFLRALVGRIEGRHHPASGQRQCIQTFGFLINASSLGTAQRDLSSEILVEVPVCWTFGGSWDRGWPNG